MLWKNVALALEGLNAFRRCTIRTVTSESLWCPASQAVLNVFHSGVCSKRPLARH